MRSLSVPQAGTSASTAYRRNRRAMSPIRPPTPPASVPAPVPAHHAGAEAGLLSCRVRLTDGRVFTGALPAARHRSIHLGLLHQETDGLVELAPGVRRDDGRLWVRRGLGEAHFLPGGACGDLTWLRRLLSHVEQLSCSPAGMVPRIELFAGVAPRVRPVGNRDAVLSTRWLWVDIDRPERLDVLWSFLSERPCHLLIASGGSGGVHAYWRLDEPLPAHWLHPDGQASEPIDRALRRIVHALGTDDKGRPNVADPQCAERARLMRIAGTVNFKSGSWARVLEADLALDPYPVDDLVGDLADPAGPQRTLKRRQEGESDDPYKRIPPPEYFKRLAGISVAGGRLVSCPVPGHRDRHPSCSVGTAPEQGWCCHSASCGARGAIYDLASVLEGGPWGQQLRGAAFARARARVIRAFGRPS